MRIQEGHDSKGEPIVSRVLSFWFGDSTDAVRREWFLKDTSFDRSCSETLGAISDSAVAGRFDQWGEDLVRRGAEGSDGALALVLLLDQIPRNIHRNTPAAFAGDGRALRLADAAVEAGLDRLLPRVRRMFLYLPFEHAEDMAAQDRAVALIGSLGDSNWLDYAVRHREIIARFGRFPHRNLILGRDSTAEEQAFLAEPGSAF